jgi:chloramphenicol 3-O phosphotransferase
MSNSHVKVIYLNGPSSSGKTTLAKALQNAFEEPFLLIGIDKIIGWMPEKMNDWTGQEAPLGFSWKASKDDTGNLIQEIQIGPYAQKIGETFREIVLTLLKMGHHVIIDDVSFGKEQIDEWRDILKDFRVLWIGVKAPLPVLEQREKERGNRIVGSARGQFHKVHVDAVYDLEVDTHQSTLSEIVKKIKLFDSNPPHHKKRLITNMKITLCPAAKKDKKIIQNLGRFYVYEMSRYCGFLPNWETPSNGLFACIDLSSYCEEPDRHAFLIKVDDELAGFVLINKVGSTPDVDWNVGEFFVISKFQGKGVGRYAANQVFDQFPGTWETTQIPQNKAAIDFWTKVVNEYSHGKYEKSHKIIPKPKPHPMNVLKFMTRPSA